MVNIILSSHGETAAGILDSSKMVFGDQEQVVAVTFARGETAETLNQKLRQAIKDFKNEEPTLFMVDLFGGTPFNQVAMIVAEHEEKMAMVTGLNLPMLLEIFGHRASGTTSAQELATQAVTPGREGIKTQPVSLMPKEKKEQSTKQKAKPAVKVGKKVAGGKGLDVRLARIDSRLLHGQVATAWTKEARPKRILVVSDNVAKDELRKSLLVSAAPSGVKVNVIPLKKLVEIWDDKRFEGVPTMLLFENPEDVRDVVKDGVALQEVNIGSMAYSVGKTMLDQSNAVDATDVKAFAELRDAGVTFGVQKVPTDHKGDIWRLIEEAGLSEKAAKTKKKVTKK